MEMGGRVVSTRKESHLFLLAPREGKKEKEKKEKGPRMMEREKKKKKPPSLRSQTRHVQPCGRLLLLPAGVVVVVP